MKIVITGGGGVLASAAAAALRHHHDVAVLSGDPRDIGEDLIGGNEALVHLDPVIGGAPYHQDERDDGDLLDRCTRGTYVTLCAAADAGVRRIVVGSSLSLFDRYPGSWAITESWEPRPDVDQPRQLATYLLEQSARQLAFSEDIEVVGLRFGAVHLDDAVQAIERAVAEAPSPPRRGWRVVHVGGAGHARMSSAEDGLTLLDPLHRVPSRPVRRVLILGGGGPLAAAAQPLLAASHTLRVTDLRPVAEIAGAAERQSVGAPLPDLLPPPHESMQVDVTNLDQVMRACDGMDAIVNCTVVRTHVEGAFRVNCTGAYNVMKAAVAHGIRRVVHTGPQLVTGDWVAAYGGDFHIPDDAPPRAGRHLYHHTKFLGQEIVRLFADQYDLEVPVLQFSSFVNPQTPHRSGSGMSPMTVSWRDAAHALCRAVEVPELPSPFEVFHILADLPQGKYSNRKARRVLGWRPRDDLQRLWTRQP